MDNMTETTQTETPTGETTAPQAPQAPAPLTGKRANWTIAHAVKGGVITWSVKGAGELTLDVAKLSEENRQRAVCHGMVQRVSDAAAMARDAKTGASATPQEKFAAMQRLVEHYAGGSTEWSPARSVEGVGRPRANPQGELLVAALKIFNPAKGEETIREFVKARSSAQITALLLSEQLKEAVELAREQLREQEARLAEGVNAEELLSGL
jgi:hypothetical protein